MSRMTGIIEGALAGGVGVQHAPHKDDGRPLYAGLRCLFRNRAERTAQDHLVGPSGPGDDDGGAFSAIKRHELFGDPVQCLGRQMQRQGRAGGRERRKVLAFGHGR